MYGHSHSHGQMRPPGHSHYQGNPQTQEQEVPCRLQTLFQLHSILSGNFFFDIIKYIPGIQIILKCYYYTIKSAWEQLHELYLMLNYRITTKIFGTGKFSRLIIGFIQINVVYNILGYSLPTFISIAIILVHLFSNIIPYLKYQLLFLIIFVISSIFVLVTYIFCFFSEPGFIDANKEKTSFEALMQGRPELNTPQMICPICQIPKICRAVHCPICNQCCTRQIKHSLIFNNCIGSQNVVYWLVFMIDISLTLIYLQIYLQLFLLAQYCLFYQKMKNTQELFLVFRIFQYFSCFSFQFMCLLKKQQQNFYLLAIIQHPRNSFIGKKCPICGEIKMVNFITLLTKLIQHLLFCSKGCRLNLYELAAPKLTNRPVLTLGNHELVNWYRAKIFTVMDIKSSPFREFIVNQMNQGRNLPPGMVWDPQTQTLKMDPNMVRQMQAMQQQMLQMMQNPQQQQQMMMQQMHQIQQMQQMHQQMQGQQHHQQFEQSEESSLMANQSHLDESTDFLNQEGHDVSLEVQKKEEEAQSLEINFEEEKKQDKIESKQDVQVEIKEEKDTETEQMNE